MSNIKQTYITYDEYRGHVAELCRQVYLSRWRPDYVVGITRGGLLPATMISHYFGIPCHTLHVSLRDSTSSPESNLWMAEDAFGYVPEDQRLLGTFDFNLHAKNILLVDDMNDSGATLKWIQEDWRSSCMPYDDRWEDIWGTNVRTAVIVNDANSAFTDIDYSSLDINKLEDPQWIVFPYEEWWR